MSRIRGVLFDLDGTLLDTAADFHESLNDLRAEENLAPLAFEEVRCQKCGRVNGEAAGPVRITCKRCGTMIEWSA